MYSALVGNKNIALELNDNEISIDNLNQELALKQLEGNKIWFTLNNKNIEATLLDVDIDKKILNIQLKNKTYQVQLKTDLEVNVEKMGMGKLAKKGDNSLVAPMPGLVLKILVEEGQEVEKDTPLLILEAMKMENVFKASKDATN
jgi:acetyl/propionyl-CoA carboxylase alpha subunit